uniref:Uncharacterized protein n=1 Tax=Knipowitschia caucasica TaxID=637954 RepID=A0AAV2MJW7_KNICA
MTLSYSDMTACKMLGEKSCCCREFQVRVGLRAHRASTLGSGLVCRCRDTGKAQVHPTVMVTALAHPAAHRSALGSHKPPHPKDESPDWHGDRCPDASLLFAELINYEVTVV